jgi:hypothetical protein
MSYRLILSILLAAGLTSPALAQSGPTPLNPSAAQRPNEPTAAQRLSGAVAAQPPSEPAAPSRSDPIQVQELSSLNPDEIGTLDDHQGLGPAMWNGSSLGVIGKAIPLLPNQPGWRAFRALEQKLLLSGAKLPPGKTAGEPLLALRVGKLAAIASPQTTASLLQLVPNPAMTPILRRLQIDNALLSGDNAAACRQEPTFRAAHINDDFAAELQIFCQFLAGKNNDASLGIDLLRDQKLHDPAFFAAAEALNGLPPSRTDGFNEATPLSLAMAGQAKLPLPESVVNVSPAPFLPAIAHAAGSPLESRLIAAEKTAGFGIGSADLARQLYSEVPFTATDLMGAAAESGKTAKGRALLYQAIAQPGAIKTDLLRRALSAEPISAPLIYAPTLMALQPSADLAAFTPWAVRALLASGHFDAANAWLTLLRTDAAAVPSSSAMIAALKPLLRLAGLADPLGGADLAAWKQARAESPADAGKHTLLLLSLLTALKDTPPDSDWLALLDGPPVITGRVSRSALAVGLMGAETAQRRGETVLYTLLSLGDQRDVEPAEFARLVGALVAVGLTDDARAFAIEVALAYGI